MPTRRELNSVPHRTPSHKQQNHQPLNNMLHLTSLLGAVMLLLLLAVGRCEAIRCDQEPPTAEGRLKKKLLCGLDTDVIPVPANAASLNVSLWFQLKEFNMVDHLDELVVHSYLTLQWQVASLTWNAAEYGDLKRLIVPSRHLWMPPFVNAPSHSGDDSDTPFCTTDVCLLNSDGRIVCFLPCKQRLHCHGHYAAWPYDQQNCSVTIRTDYTLLNDTRLRLQLNRATFDSSESQNKEFNLRTMHAVELNATALEIAIEVYRQTSLAMLMFGGPAMLMIATNVLALVLVPSSGERLTLLAFNLLLHGMAMPVANGYVPAHGDEVPLIFIFFARSLFTTLVLLVYTLLVRSVYECREPVSDRVHGVIEALSFVTLGGRLSSSGYFVEQKYTHFASKDVTVESQIRVDRERAVYEDWQRMAAAIDRIAFVMLVCWYIVVVALYSPLRG